MKDKFEIVLKTHNSELITVKDNKKGRQTIKRYINENNVDISQITIALRDTIIFEVEVPKNKIADYIEKKIHQTNT